MLPYRNESAFSAALCKLLTNKGIFHQRIESGLTGCGIPDLYIRLSSKEIWVELKNDKIISIKAKLWLINWRKGQQSWMLNYKKVSNRYGYTVVACKDGFLVIPMNKRYVKNIVHSDEVFSMTSIKDILGVLC